MNKGKDRIIPLSYVLRAFRKVLPGEESMQVDANGCSVWRDVFNPELTRYCFSLSQTHGIGTVFRLDVVKGPGMREYGCLSTNTTYPAVQFIGSEMVLDCANKETEVGGMTRSLLIRELRSMRPEANL